MRIGIDVGGTHTDAALLEGNDILATTKVLTTRDVKGGILNALSEVLERGPKANSPIEAVMLGTTQFTNAVIERREMSESAIIRIALPCGDMVPPMIDWPDDIKAALGHHVYMVHGGRKYDSTPLAPTDDEEIEKVISDIEHKGIKTIAISSAFSLVDPTPELDVAARLRARIPDVRISLSHEIGRVGIMERENAALLNAALLPFADRVVSSFSEALSEHGIDAPFFVSQNDGTLMVADFVRRYPALTFSSGPTNSLRGASLLTGEKNAIVVDIGGTTTDIGVIRDGFPRESNIGIEVGGIRTNFRMPDILSIGLGGGSLVQNDGQTIGPQSVGYQLVKKGYVFGGDVLTTTDIAVAAGTAKVGDASYVKNLSPDMVERALINIHELVDDGVDRMRDSRDPVPVILVGGGAILMTKQLRTASRILKPDHAGVANAIGAAIAQVGGEVEQVFSYNKVPREQAIVQATESATKKAIEAGADPSTIRRVDIEETSISYMGGDTTRLRIKMVGALALNSENVRN